MSCLLLWNSTFNKNIITKTCICANKVQTPSKCLYGACLHEGHGWSWAYPLSPLGERRSPPWTVHQQLQAASSQTNIQTHIHTSGFLFYLFLLTLTRLYFGIWEERKLTQACGDHEKSRQGPIVSSWSSEAWGRCSNHECSVLPLQPFCIKQGRTPSSWQNCLIIYHLVSVHYWSVLWKPSWYDTGPLAQTKWASFASFFFFLRAWKQFKGRCQGCNLWKRQPYQPPANGPACCCSEASVNDSLVYFISPLSAFHRRCYCTSPSYQLPAFYSRSPSDVVLHR